MTTSSDRAYRELRRLILGGEIDMGAHIGETLMATQLQTSRTPVREALRRLEADGLVEVESNRGARVAFWTAADRDEIFVLRSLLEGHGAALAAAAISEHQVDQLESLCEEMEKLMPGRHVAAEVERLNELNHRFHEDILIASGSKRLPGLVASVVQLPLARHTFDRYSDESMRRSAGHHRELVSALRARNPDWARAVMEAHIQAARFEVASWREGDPAAPEPPG